MLLVEVVSTAPWSPGGISDEETDVDGDDRENDAKESQNRDF